MVQDAVYDPPSLPSYIPVELKPITGPPTNKEIASVHAALRISEGYAGAPSIFDPDLHTELSQHLFDIQLARHVQRSMAKHFTPTQPPSSCSDADVDSATLNPGAHDSLVKASFGAIVPTEPLDKQPNLPDEATTIDTLEQTSHLLKNNELMVEIRDTLKTMNRTMIASQNSLARGFNSSSWHAAGYDLGAHTLLNQNGELPEECNLPSFKQEINSDSRSLLPARTLTEEALAGYLRFYDIGNEMLEGEEMKIKPGMVEKAKNLLAQHLGSRWG